MNILRSVHNPSSTLAHTENIHFHSNPHSSHFTPVTYCWPFRRLSWVKYNAHRGSTTYSRKVERAPPNAVTTVPACSCSIFSECVCAFDQSSAVRVLENNSASISGPVQPSIAQHSSRLTHHQTISFSDRATCTVPGALWKCTWFPAPPSDRQIHTEVAGVP